MLLCSRREPSELTPIEDPPRDTEYLELLEQVKKTGFLEPLIISKDGLVVDGCRRWLIAQELGLKLLDVLVLQEKYTRTELLQLRAVLHCARRRPRLEEMEIVAGLTPKERARAKPTPHEIEELINDMFCAQGLGPRVMMEIVKHTPIVVVPGKTDEEQDLEIEMALREVGWKNE